MDHRDFRPPAHRHLAPDIPWRDDRDDRDVPFNMRHAWGNAFTAPQPAPSHWNHKGRDRRGDRSPSSDATSTIGGNLTDSTTATTKSTRTMNPLAMAKRGGEEGRRRQRRRENEHPQPQHQLLQPIIPPSPVAATITTTTTTKTTTKKQIYLHNPGVDVALRNLRHEVESSLKTYDSLLRNFLVETSMLRASGAVDQTTLDRIWWDKIAAKIRDSRNPEGKRKKIEYVGVRISEHRRLIREAIDRARSSIEVLFAQTRQGHQRQHAPSPPPALGNGKAVDFEKLRFPHSDDEDDSDCVTRSGAGGSGGGGGTSVVVTNTSEGVLEKVRLLERQIRAGKKAIEHCDGIAAYHPERAMVEYFAGWDLVKGLKKLDGQFRGWTKKYDWILFGSDCRNP